MAEIVKVWTAPIAARQDPAQPITSQWGNDVWDNLEYLKQWLGHDFIAGAVQNHNHDGVNSAEVNLITGLIPNGSFDNVAGTLPTGWTKTEYTGGTVALTDTVNANGNQSLAMTSINLADGGGEIIHDTYRPITGGTYIPIEAVRWASIADVSCKADVIWYDKDKVQISITNLFTDTNTSLTSSIYNNSILAPASARYMRLRLTGGIPATGAAVGTIYFDGCLAIELPANSIRQIHMEDAAIGQSELKTATGTTSTASTTREQFTLAGGAYGFYPQIRMNSAENRAWEANITSNNSLAFIGWTANKTNITLKADGGRVIYAVQTYVTASRPYNMGDGEIGQFIFAIIDNTTGKVESVYSAPEAPWHYNGKTDIRGKLRADGKKYRVRRDMSDIPFAVSSIANDPVKMAEYVAAFNAAPTLDELITPELCQKDMPDIPHPFMGNDLTGKTVVMLDPVSDLNHELYEMCTNHDEFDLNQLLHDGYITVGNSDIGRVSPNGVLVPSFKWKQTI